jgi:hypothetical protein
MVRGYSVRAAVWHAAYGGTGWYPYKPTGEIRLIDSIKGAPTPSYSLPDGSIRDKPDLQM